MPGHSLLDCGTVLAAGITFCCVPHVPGGNTPGWGGPTFCAPMAPPPLQLTPEQSYTSADMPLTPDAPLMPPMWQAAHAQAGASTPPGMVRSSPAPVCYSTCTCPAQLTTRSMGGQCCQGRGMQLGNSRGPVLSSVSLAGSAGQGSVRRWGERGADARLHTGAAQPAGKLVCFFTDASPWCARPTAP